MTENANAQPSSDHPQEDYKILARRLAKHCVAYRGADTRRSIVQLILTAVPFAALTGAMLLLIARDHWAGMLLAIPAGGFLVRMFIIQHDCGHGSFFRTRRANDMLGRLISLFTLTPYSFWQKAHAMHHATSGNLGNRGFGDIDTLTVAEYRALPTWKQLRYRIYRNPLVLFVFGMPYHFIIGQRIPFGMPFSFAKVWRSVLFTDVAVFVFYGLVAYWVGLGTFLIVYLPVLSVAAWIGGWLFYIQHQFSETHWAPSEEWDFHSAAILGSSYYILPPALHWITGNIGLHHIHHLCGTIPFYRLQECLAASPELQGISRLTIRESLKSVSLTLWDEATHKLVGFGDLKPA
ncbi:MAG TPA: fatty acid desaturase [Magnetovibrio sp.]